jgi:transposase
MPERRRKYTPEFKDEAAKMVVETSRPIAEVAREIHVNEGTLGNWVKTYREAYAKPLENMTKNWRPRRSAT